MAASQSELFQWKKIFEREKEDRKWEAYNKLGKIRGRRGMCSPCLEKKTQCSQIKLLASLKKRWRARTPIRSQLLFSIGPEAERSEHLGTTETVFFGTGMRIRKKEKGAENGHGDERGGR